MIDPIDAVVLWVDGSDYEWNMSRNHYWNLYKNICKDSNADQRFVCCDELKYCLRGLYYNVDWLRTIYIITCGQVPKWLNIDHPKIKLIFHKDIIEAEHLPTFNSCTIEMNLHKIYGLSECFLYLNDDCFVTKKTTKQFFFHKSGKAYFYSHRPMINPVGLDEATSFNWTIYNNQQCLNQLFGIKIRPRPDHQAYILYKSAILHIIKNVPLYVESTNRQKFRVDATTRQKTLNAYIYATSGFELGLYTLKINQDQQYYTIQQAKNHSRFIVKNRPTLLCINNASTYEDAKFINQLMSEMLPIKAPWELTLNLNKGVQLCNTLNTDNVISQAKKSQNKLIHLSSNYQQTKLF